MGSFEARARDIVDDMFRGTKPYSEEPATPKPYRCLPDSSPYVRIPEVSTAIGYGAGCLIVALELETKAASIREEGVYTHASDVAHRAELEAVRVESAAYILSVLFPSVSSDDWFNTFRVNAIADLENAKAAFAAAE